MVLKQNSQQVLALLIQRRHERDLNSVPILCLNNTWPSPIYVNSHLDLRPETTSYPSRESKKRRKKLIAPVLDSVPYLGTAWFVQFLILSYIDMSALLSFWPHPHTAQSLCPQASREKGNLDASNPPWSAGCLASLGENGPNISLAGMNQSWNLNIHFQHHQDKE